MKVSTRVPKTLRGRHIEMKMRCSPGDGHIKRVLQDGRCPVARYWGEEEQQGRQGGLHHLSLFPTSPSHCHSMIHSKPPWQSPKSLSTGTRLQQQHDWQPLLTAVDLSDLYYRSLILQPAERVLAHILWDPWNNLRLISVRRPAADWGGCYNVQPPVPARLSSGELFLFVSSSPFPCHLHFIRSSSLFQSFWQPWLAAKIYLNLLSQNLRKQQKAVTTRHRLQGKSLGLFSL